MPSRYALPRHAPKAPVRVFPTDLAARSSKLKPDS